MRNYFAVFLLGIFSFLMVPLNHASAQETAEVHRKVISQVLPQYPNLARSMNIQGTVRADVTVSPNGKVKSVAVKGGHPLLGQSAQEALQQWKWEPTAHETHEIVELKFHP